MKSNFLELAAVLLLFAGPSAFAAAKAVPKPTPRENVNDIHVSGGPDSTPAAAPDTTPHHQKMTAGVEAKSAKPKTATPAQSQGKSKPPVQ